MNSNHAKLMPSPQWAAHIQDEVLRPGGAFLGSDSLPSDGLHRFHEGDIYYPLEPAAFLTRLQTVGFTAITLRVANHLIFTARKESSS